MDPGSGSPSEAMHGTAHGTAHGALAGVASAELRAQALRAWRLANPQAKVAAALALGRHGTAEALHCDPASRLDGGLLPGRPARPRLVEPRALPKRGPRTAAGRNALLHAIAHIEFNAIDLALDAVWRFPGMPSQFYRDWAGVAAEEAEHFTLLRDELVARGTDYGAFDAHDGLWAIAVRTAGDVLDRIALVPRLMEARGLDVTPGLQAALAQAGDTTAVAILQRILDDEVGHVAIGNHWYRHLCRERGLDPLSAWTKLAAAHRAPLPRPPFNLDARRRAGFDDEELRAWR